jgi:hypothetical protein
LGYYCRQTFKKGGLMFKKIKAKFVCWVFEELEKLKRIKKEDEEKIKRLNEQEKCRKKTGHNPRKSQGGGGLENVGIQNLVCLGCGKILKSEAVYHDEEGNEIRRENITE